MEAAPLDDLGRGMPWATDVCPARGDLPHQMTRDLVGNCAYCSKEVCRRVNWNETWHIPNPTQREMVDLYRTLGRRHAARAIEEDDQRRPMRARRHRNAHSILARAAMGEDFDLPPDVLP